MRSNVKYQLMKIVQIGAVDTPVESLDDLELIDKKGDAISQLWLDNIIAHMNGEKDIGDPSKGMIFSGKTLSHVTVARQVAVTRSSLAGTIRDDLPEELKRECLRATCMLEKDTLHEFAMANRLGTANKKVAVFVLSSGTGCHNTDARRSVGFLTPIPTALLTPMDRLKQLQDHFGLLDHGDNPIYLDFLDKDVALFLGISLI